MGRCFRSNEVSETSNSAVRIGGFKITLAFLQLSYLPMT